MFILSQLKFTSIADSLPGYTGDHPFAIIIYDGPCILCNKMVQLLIELDIRKQLYFTTFASDFTSKHLPAHLIPKGDPEEVMVISEKGIQGKTAAFLEILRLTGRCRFAYYALKIIPLPISDYIYKVVAKNRYRIFGKSDKCGIWPENEKQRFLT